VHCGSGPARKTDCHESYNKKRPPGYLFQIAHHPPLIFLLKPLHFFATNRKTVERLSALPRIGGISLVVGGSMTRQLLA
jgi:hypothetical protein